MLPVVLIEVGRPDTFLDILLTSPISMFNMLGQFIPKQTSCNGVRPVTNRLIRPGDIRFKKLSSFKRCKKRCMLRKVTASANKGSKTLGSIEDLSLRALSAESNNCIIG